ncbi:unnamed protein product [Urochloa humidicola]
MNYHSRSSESVTTVITEMINHMSAKEKGDVLVEQDQDSNRGYHGGGGVQKHSAYKEEVLYEGSATGVKKRGYKQKYCKGAGYGAYYGMKKQGYKHKQPESCGETGTGHVYYGQATYGQIPRYAQDTGTYGTGYGSQYGGGAVQEYRYTQHEKYNGAATYAAHNSGWTQHEKYNGAATYAAHNSGCTQNQKYNGAATYAAHNSGWTEHDKYDGEAL